MRTENVELTVLCLIHKDGEYLLQNRIKNDWKLRLSGLQLRIFSLSFPPKIVVLPLGEYTHREAARKIRLFADTACRLASPSMRLLKL